ncbi:MAG: preprotein translocase subunit SecA [Candidatus Omnitrophota bacterium]
MLKKIILSKCRKRINSIKPPVQINVTGDIPTPSIREISNWAPIAGMVNSFEEELKDKPAGFFKDITSRYKNEISEKLKNIPEDKLKAFRQEVLDNILPYYFAVVREAAFRAVKMRHFDVQVLGGVSLHKNMIAEMVTGEGKTLVATLSASLNALCGMGVHIVTVNDYLAKRDREWMGPIFEYLGFTVGVIQNESSKEERKAAYSCDITYGTNNEFGFDYLRDNMEMTLSGMVQRSHFYAIIDEVDSILVDEARTPLIISGPAEASVEKYYLADRAVRQLSIHFIIQSFDGKGRDGMVTVKHSDGSEKTISLEDFETGHDAIVEEKASTAYLTPRGEKRCEKLLGVNNLEEAPDKYSEPWMHYITQSLRARYLFRKDKDYIVKNGKAIIVDDFTGRLMPGRRWSDGLHQGVEAKENLRIEQENQTLATVTLQNYFRMYEKLAGMTGTAYTEANEFRHIYKLDVAVMPTNEDLIRTNFPDRIYKTKDAKFKAVVSEIEELYEKKRPVLVGTTSIEDSEEVSFLLGKKGIQHNVLNAKYHEREAFIVAQAGRMGQVTIATNMAGRGTDIILGGNIDYFIKDMLSRNNIGPEDPLHGGEYENLYQKYKYKFEEEHKAVVELGGLHVIGTQRHESRRIDNQLRGRSGRQGDPGSSRFYVSLEDDLLRLFGSLGVIHFLMNQLPDDQPIEHSRIKRPLEIAQKRVEGHHFEARKDLLKYDNIMNSQREIIYSQRRDILERDDIKEDVLEMLKEVIGRNAGVFFGEDRDSLGLYHWFKSKFDIDISTSKLKDMSLDEALEYLHKIAMDVYLMHEQKIGPDNMRRIEKFITIRVVDGRWKEHLLIMDSLREGISLRAHAQQDPLVEYQKESYEAFNAMVASVKEGVTDLIFKANLFVPQDEEGVSPLAAREFVHSRVSLVEEAKAAAIKPPEKKAVPIRSGKKVGRNEPCPCGSGKKYKKCCGIDK